MLVSARESFCVAFFFLLPDGGAGLLVGAEGVDGAQDQQREQAQRREAQHAAPGGRRKTKMVDCGADRG